GGGRHRPKRKKVESSMPETSTSILTRTQSASRRARFILLPRNLTFWFIWRGVLKKWSRIGFFCARCGDQTVRSNLSIYECLSVSFVRRSNLKHRRRVIFIPNLGSAIALIRPGDNFPFRGSFVLSPTILG